MAAAVAGPSRSRSYPRVPHSAAGRAEKREKEGEEQHRFALWRAAPGRQSHSPRGGGRWRSGPRPRRRGGKEREGGKEGEDGEAPPDGGRTQALGGKGWGGRRAPAQAARHSRPRRAGPEVRARMCGRPAWVVPTGLPAAAGAPPRSASRQPRHLRRP